MFECKFKAHLLTATSAAALMVCAQAPSAEANSIVASIYGVYDAECGNNITCLGPSSPWPGATSYATNGGQQYDTPSLFIINQSGQTMTGVSMALTGYQGNNNGLTATVSLPDLAAGEVYQYTWNGSLTPGNLLAYDYDDEYGSTAHTAGGGKLPACDPQPYNICAYVGNFDVKLTATINGNPNAANFSPDNTQGGGNQAGTFVGWLGLDPSGLSETAYDDHFTIQEGVLAYMYTGTTGNQVTTPEPASLSLMGAGLGALAIARRRRKKV